MKNTISFHFVLVLRLLQVYVFVFLSVQSILNLHMHPSQLPEKMIYTKLIKLIAFTMNDTFSGAHQYFNQSSHLYCNGKTV